MKCFAAHFFPPVELSPTGSRIVTVPLSYYECALPYFDVRVCALVQGEEEAWDGPPFEVNGDRMEFSLTVFGLDNYLYYPLVINQTYRVDVSCSYYYHHSICSSHLTCFIYKWRSKSDALYHKNKCYKI